MPRIALSALIGTPAQVRDRVMADIPREIRPAKITVQPCDAQGRRSAAWSADHYRLCAFYVYSGTPLAPLEAALKVVPGVYETHQVTGGKFGHLTGLRVMVIALMREVPGDWAR